MKTSDIVKLLELAYDQGFGTDNYDDYDTEDEKYKQIRVNGISWLVTRLTRMIDDQQDIKLNT